MFKKKSVVMKMVNDNKLNLEPSPPVDVAEISHEFTKSVATLIIVFVAADTVRQSVLHVVKTTI